MERREATSLNDLEYIEIKKFLSVLLINIHTAEVFSPIMLLFMLEKCLKSMLFWSDEVGNSVEKYLAEEKKNPGSFSVVSMQCCSQISNECS